MDSPSQTPLVVFQEPPRAAEDIPIEQDIAMDESLCPVCMESIRPDRNNATTCCGHKFCLICVTTMLSRNIKLCPCCRCSMVSPTPLVVVRAPRVLPPSFTLPAATGGGLNIAVPPIPSGENEYSIFCKLRRPVQWFLDKFQCDSELAHPIIVSSSWTPTANQDNIDVRNFAKLFRTFDFPNNVRMPISTMYTEFIRWRIYQHNIRHWVRHNITLPEFESLIYRLGVVKSHTRGRSIAMGNCRSGYNVFIYGSVQCSDTNDFLGRVIVDSPLPMLPAPASLTPPLLTLPAPASLAPPTPISPPSLGERGLFSNLISAIRIILVNRAELGGGFTQNTLLEVIHRQFEPTFTFDQVRYFYGDFIVSDDMDELMEIYSWMG